MTIPPDIAFLENLQYRTGMGRFGNEIGVHNIKEAFFHKIGDIGMPVSSQPVFPFCLGRSWTENIQNLLFYGLGRANPEPGAEEILNSAEVTSHRTATGGFDYFARMVEFFIK